MYERELMRMRKRVRAREYVMTLHAEEEMNEDGYTIYDVEHGILTGAVLERQRDPETAESKYRVRGHTVASGEIELVTKLGPTGRLVIITVYVP